MKEPLPFVFERGNATAQVMLQLAAEGWTAPDVIAPDDFAALLVTLADQEDTVAAREAQFAVAAGQWDGVLQPWHHHTVTVLKLARVHFAGTPFAAVWRGLRARGDSRATIKAAGTAAESAWQASEPAWVPKAGLTLAASQQFHTQSNERELAWNQADKNLKAERGLLDVQADGVTTICVKWYAIATATWAEGTTQGNLIRTIPTSYNPNRPPGLLRFVESFSPAPNQVRLSWKAARGEKFNIYAKGPGSNVWDRFLDGVAQDSWTGEGVSAGEWLFKGVATNAFGTGEVSAEVSVPVPSALAA